MDMEVIKSAASEVLVNIALAVITLAGAYALHYIRLGASKLKAQTTQITEAAGRKLLEDAIDDVTRLAYTSVRAMEQTTAKELREAVKSGKVDRKALIYLGEQVFTDVRRAISPEAQELITKNLGSFNRYLKNCIENAVLDLKQSNPYAMLPEGVMVGGDTESTKEDAAQAAKP